MFSIYTDWILFCILNIYYINRVGTVNPENTLTRDQRVSELLTRDVRAQISRTTRYLERVNLSIVISIKLLPEMGCLGFKATGNTIITHISCIQSLLQQPQVVQGLEAIDRTNNSIRADVLEVYYLGIRDEVTVENIALVELVLPLPNSIATHLSNLRLRRCTGDLEVCCYPVASVPTRPTLPMTLPTTVPSTLPTTFPTLPTTLPPRTTTTTTTTRPPPIVTIPTTSLTLPTIPTIPSIPSIDPRLPQQYCFCVPILQCAILNAYGSAAGGSLVGTGLINSRQQIAATCLGAYVCCGYAAATAGPTAPMASQTFSPFLLPTTQATTAASSAPSNAQLTFAQQPPASSSSSSSAAALPPIVIGQSCVCVQITLCVGGTAPMSWLGSLDPRQILARQGQPAGSCAASANSVCCRLVQDGAQHQTHQNPANQHSDAAGFGSLDRIDASDFRNPGTPDACVCVPDTQCAEGNAVTFDGVGVIDPRFGPCASATRVCCRMQNRQSLDYYLSATALNSALSIIDVAQQQQQQTSAVCGSRDTTYANPQQQSPDTAYFGEFPWMAILLIRKPGSNDVLQCGGSLINSRTILTAAHCIAGCDPGTLVARLGEWRTDSEAEPLPYQEASVQTVIIHPQYYSGALFHDVAIVLLARPLLYAVNVRPVCMPGQGQTFAPGAICYASGWGRTAFGTNGQYQSTLRKVDLPIVDNASCQARLRLTRLGPLFQLHSSFICAGGIASKDTCYKDGGGPLVCQDQVTGKFVQAGIISWGIGCGDTTPAVYASVAQHRDWIDQTLQLYGIYN